MNRLRMMRIRLILLFLLAAAFSAAAQAPPRYVYHYPAVMPPADIHFVDGTSGMYPIERIGKELMRVGLGNDDSRRIPLTIVKSIQFSDGCTLFFEEGKPQFDKLVQPAHLKNENGDALLEGVLPLSKPQAEALMGPAYYPQFRKQSRLLLAGEITLFTGTGMVLPYLGTAIVSSVSKQVSFADTFKEMSPVWKGVTVGGCGVLLAGIVVILIGNSGCNRIIADYNNGLGVAYTF